MVAAQPLEQHIVILPADRRATVVVVIMRRVLARHAAPPMFEIIGNEPTGNKPAARSGPEPPAAIPGASARRSRHFLG